MILSENHRSGVILVLLGALIVSPIGVVVAALGAISSSELLIYRCIGVFLFFLLLLMVKSKKSLIHTIRSAGKTGFFAGFALSLALVSSMYSFQNTTVTRTLLLFSISPIFAAILSWIFLNEKLSLATLASVCLAILGIGFVVLGGPDDQTAAMPNLLSGDISAFCGSFAYAVFSVLLRVGQSTDMRPAMLYAGLFGLIFGVVFWLTAGGEVYAGATEILIMLGAGFFLTGTAFLLFTIGSKFVAAAEFAMISLSEVFWGSLWAFVFMNQIVSAETAMGAVLFFSAVFINVKYGPKS